MPTTKKREVHPTHQMSRWRDTIISTANSDRFGSIRICKACEGEQAKTVTGTHTHEVLWRPCPSSEEGMREARIEKAAPALYEALKECVAQLKQSSVAWAEPIQRAESILASIEKEENQG